MEQKGFWCESVLLPDRERTTQGVQGTERGSLVLGAVAFASLQLSLRALICAWKDMDDLKVHKSQLNRAESFRDFFARNGL